MKGLILGDSLPFRRLYRDLVGHGASLMVAALLHWRTIPSVPATAAAFTVAAGV